MLDLDERGPSRSQRRLASGGVLVKATVFPEWNSVSLTARSSLGESADAQDWLTPWVHYVVRRPDTADRADGKPTQVDYSDLYSILSFFIGPPDARRPGHDDLAEPIAENGENFAEDHWRWEDMQAYMLRLLLE